MATQAESKLKPRQRQAVTLLVAKTPDEVCLQLGISRPTLWRWRQLQCFQTALREAQEELFSQATGQLKQNLEQAVKTIAGLMASERDDVSLRAATALIEFTLRIRRDENVEERLARLEEAIGQGR